MIKHASAETADAWLSVNGEPQAYVPGMCLLDLLLRLGMQPALVAVERNGEIVPKRLFGETMLLPRDRLELVTFVGGG